MTQNSALNDPDEEVRERAFQNIVLLEESDKTSYLEDMAKSAAAPVDFEEITFIEKYISMNQQSIEETDEDDILSKEKIYSFARSQNI